MKATGNMGASNQFGTFAQTFEQDPIDFGLNDDAIRELEYEFQSKVNVNNQAQVSPILKDGSRKRLKVTPISDTYSTKQVKFDNQC